MDVVLEDGLCDDVDMYDENMKLIKSGSDESMRLNDKKTLFVDNVSYAGK
jgi:hypothetical protein